MCKGLKPNDTAALRSRESCYYTVKLLVGEGADINAEDKYGKTPLTIATRKGYSNIVNVLTGVNLEEEEEEEEELYEEDRGV